MMGNIVKNKVNIFSGAVGSGKTTIIKIIISNLGVDEGIITSPTYVYQKTYNCGQNKFNIKNIAHIDLYRIEDKNKVIQMLDELDADMVFIEWGDKYQDTFVEPVIWKVQNSFGRRTLKISHDLAGLQHSS